MVEPEEIAVRIAELLGALPRPGSCTAGGCSSRRARPRPLDSVRFVGSRSSGRMGVALAEEARSRGADVTRSRRISPSRRPPG